MIHWSIARRYARALFESVGDDVEQAAADLEAVAKSIEGTPGFLAYLENPAVGIEERRTIAASILEATKVHPMVANLIRLLAERDRLSVILGIATVFNQLADEALGRVHAEVVSAFALPEETRIKLQGAIAEATKKKVDLQVAEDPALLGGVVAKVGSTVFDGSLRTQLETLRRDLAVKA